MNIASYIQATFNTSTPLPFETKLFSFQKRNHIINIGDVEQYIYFMQSGIVEVGMLKDGDERIIDFFFAGEFFQPTPPFSPAKRPMFTSFVSPIAKWKQCHTRGC